MTEKSILIDALKSKIRVMEADIEQAKKVLTRLENDNLNLTQSSIEHSKKDDAKPKRSIKWHKIILQALLELDRFSITEDIYQLAIQNNITLQEMEQRKLTSGLSGAVSSLRKKGTIKLIKDQIGNSLYGYKDWMPHDRILATYQFRIIEDGYTLPKEEKNSFMEDESFDDLPF